MGVLWLIAAIYDKIRPYILKMVDALLVVVDKIKTLWTFIKDGLGITKGEKRAAFLKAAEGTGYKYVVGEKDKDAGTTYTGWKNEHGDKISPSALPTDIRRAYEAYVKAPDSVFAQISDYLSGILANVAEVLDPVLSPLSIAVTKLTDFLADIFGEEVPTAEILTDKNGVPMNFGPTQDEDYVPPPPVTAEVLTDDAGNPLPFGPKEMFEPGNAGGITFLRDGVFTGKFHGPEETLGREATIRGPGIIARAMSALDISARSARQSSSVPEIHIHNENRFDFAGARIDSAFDVQGFLREVDKRIESGSKKAVERAIGQGRT